MKQVVEDFAQYLYLQRLRDPEVLLNAIRDGVNLMTWPTDSFAYAEGWDEGKKRYVGLQAGRLVAIGQDSTGLLVKPDVAQAQMNAEVPPPVQAPAPAGGQTPPAIPGGKTTVSPSPAPAAPKPPTRFYGSVRLDALRMVRDAGTLSKEVVEHLTSQLGAEVEITLESRRKSRAASLKRPSVT